MGWCHLGEAGGVSKQELFLVTNGLLSRSGIASPFIDNIGHPVVVIDSQGRVVFVNQTGRQATGCTLDELKGRFFWDVIPSPEDREWAREAFSKPGLDHFPYQHEGPWASRDGEPRLIHSTCTAVTDPSGRPEYFIIIGFDVTPIKKYEEELKRLSLHDSLTGLYNRVYFEEELQRLEGSRNHPIGLILCDLDGLKLVNDTLGHDAGDVLLATAAEIIRECFRKSDVVARIGGDEFAVLLPGSSREIVENAYRRILLNVEEYNKSQPVYPLSISMGYAVSEAPAVSLGSLFREADNNMYREKTQRSQAMRNQTVRSLLKKLEAKDFANQGHTERLLTLAAGLARTVGLAGGLGNLRRLVQFHDLGKLSIPDPILFKTGPLNSEEKALIQRHSEIGRRIALSVPALAPIADLILKHHEWWDGGGYPLGLREEAVPIECRILSVAEAYEVMTSVRPYRGALNHEEAVAELRRCAGSQFDPWMVSRFIVLLEKKQHLLSGSPLRSDKQHQLSMFDFLK
ncbi:MAG: diguanylate cyclase [Firmicutes bacterium]|nr:diguanylate cyclase [Bacillota bacterium]